MSVPINSGETMPYPSRFEGEHFALKQLASARVPMTSGKKRRQHVPEEIKIQRVTPSDKVKKRVRVIKTVYRRESRSQPGKLQVIEKSTEKKDSEVATSKFKPEDIRSSPKIFRPPPVFSSASSSPDSIQDLCTSFSKCTTTFSRDLQRVNPSLSSIKRPVAVRPVAIRPVAVRPVAVRSLPRTAS